MLRFVKNLRMTLFVILYLSILSDIVSKISRTEVLKGRGEHQKAQHGRIIPVTLPENKVESCPLERNSTDKMVKSRKRCVFLR